MSISQIKKKMKLYYRHSKDGDTYLLKVICRERWDGIGLVVKCKVLTKGWYETIYLTPGDFMRDTRTWHVRAVTNTEDFLME
jgi:hypothetical protein